MSLICMKIIIIYLLIVFVFFFLQKEQYVTTQIHIIVFMQRFGVLQKPTQIGDRRARFIRELNVCISISKKPLVTHSTVQNKLILPITAYQTSKVSQDNNITVTLYKTANSFPEKVRSNRMSIKPKMDTQCPIVSEIE